MSATELLKFEPLYFADRLHIINPVGDIGVVTLWTPVKTAISFLGRHGIDISPESSRIAVVGNYYGDGYLQLIANLLYNPQITSLIIFGQDLSNSSKDLIHLLQDGVRLTIRNGQEKLVVNGTGREIPTDIPAELLHGRYLLFTGGKPSSTVATGIANFISALNSTTCIQQLEHGSRIKIDLPVNKPTTFPSEPRSHTITRRHPIDAWEEVVCRTLRFGVPSIAGKIKERLELQNLKVVITEPVFEYNESLLKYGFTLDEMTSYGQQMLNGGNPIGDLNYTYGNRLCNYWKDFRGVTTDQLEVAANKLTEDPTSRGVYISLWDPRRDLENTTDESVPCLVSLFFRVFENKLTLTATFRAHNVMSAWLKNIYGLMAIQRHVHWLIGVAVGSSYDLFGIGAITVISHSISIDPTSLDRYKLAQQISKDKTDDLELDRESGKRSLRLDSNGYFTFKIDPLSNEIVVEHRHDSELLTTYTGKTANEIMTQLSRDNTISDVSHAIYVGKQLAIYEILLYNQNTEIVFK